MMKYSLYLMGLATCLALSGLNVSAQNDRMAVKKACAIITQSIRARRSNVGQQTCKRGVPVPTEAEVVKALISTGKNGNHGAMYRECTKNNARARRSI